MSQNQEIIESKLCAYIDGDLDPEGRAEIEKHLEANPQHRRLLESLRATRDLLRWLPREPAPPELAETLNGQLERSALLDYAEDSLRPSRLPRFLAAAAIVLLTAGLGVAVYYALPRSQKSAQLAMHVPSPGEVDSGRTLAAEAAPGSATPVEPERKQAISPLASANPAPSDRGAPLALAAPPVQQKKLASAQETGKSPPQLDQLADQFAQNAGVLPAGSGVVVLRIESSSPRRAEQQVAEYLGGQQIAWRQMGGAGGNLQVGRRQFQAMDALKNRNLSYGNAAPTTRPADTQGAQVGQLALAGRTPGVASTTAPASGEQQQTSIPEAGGLAVVKGAFVCLMSRTQMNELADAMSRDGAKTARIEPAATQYLEASKGASAEAAAPATTQPAQPLAQMIRARTAGEIASTQPAAPPALAPTTQPAIAATTTQPSGNHPAAAGDIPPAEQVAENGEPVQTQPAAADAAAREPMRVVILVEASNLRTAAPATQPADAAGDSDRGSVPQTQPAR